MGKDLDKLPSNYLENIEKNLKNTIKMLEDLKIF